MVRGCVSVPYDETPEGIHDLMSTQTAPVDIIEPVRPTCHGTALVAAASFSALVVALQQTLVVPAIPRLPGILGASASSTSWAVTATLLTGAASTPIVSRLADMVGKKKMMLVSVAFVLLGSLIAPLGGLTTIILGRALQGLGTALVPVAMSIMRDELPRERAGGAAAFLSATLGIGGAIGIPLGGAVLGSLGWQWLFWLSAILAALSLAAIVKFVPETPMRNPVTFDLVGAVLLTLSLSSLLLGVSKGAEWGWISPLTLGAFASSIIGFLLWGTYELRLKHPLVDLRTAARRPVLLTDLASLTLGMLMFANLLVTTIQLQGSTSQHGFAQTAQVAGLATLPTAVAMLAIAPIASAVSRRYGPRMVLILGTVITLLTYALRGVATPNAAMVIVWATVASVGIALGYAALPMLIFTHVEPHETAEANGLNALLRAVGTAVASAFVGAIGAAFAVTAGGRVEPSWQAITGIFLAGAIVSVITLVIAAGIPRRR